MTSESNRFTSSNSSSSSSSPPVVRGRSRSRRVLQPSSPLILRASSPWWSLRTDFFISWNCSKKTRGSKIFNHSPPSLFLILFLGFCGANILLKGLCRHAAHRCKCVCFQFFWQVMFRLCIIVQTNLVLFGFLATSKALLWQICSIAWDIKLIKRNCLVQIFTMAILVFHLDSFFYLSTVDYWTCKFLGGGHKGWC